MKLLEVEPIMKLSEGFVRVSVSINFETNSSVLK